MGKNLKGKELGVGIGQAKDKRYYARYTDRYGKRSAPFYSFSLKEVKDWLTVQRYEDKMGIRGQPPKNDMTVGNVYELWIKEKAKAVRPQTLNAIEGRYKNHIKPYELYMIKDITRDFAETFIAELSDKELCLGAVKLIKGTFSQIMEYAINKRLCTENPFERCKIPKKLTDKAAKRQREIRETKFLTPEQQEIFLQYIYANETCKYRDLYKLLLLTGLRIGEAIALKWEHIDFERKCINVQDNAVTYRDSEGIIHKNYDAPTKNIYSTAKMPMTDETVEFLTELRAKSNNLSSGLVFLNKKGKPVCYGTINYDLKRIIEILNHRSPPDKQFPKVTPHYFRHTFAENYIDKGVSLTAVQYCMRHANLTTTANAYGHASYSVAQAAIEQLGTKN